MFDALFSGLAWLLNFFYELIPNYGVAIALLTLTVMLVFFPLTAKATRSMAAMSKLSPELRRIQQKYKDDRVKQNEEVMALFKEHNVTPFGGCVPLLVQMPVLMVMYQVLLGLTRRGSDGTFNPKYLTEGQALYDALDPEKKMMAFGIDLAKNASDALKVSFVSALPFLVLIAGVVATGYYQQRMMSRRNPQAQNDDNPMARQMQMMTRIYPLMYLVFGFTLPAGINVYFLVSSVFRIGQQALIYKMDPTLLPSSGAKTVASREVTDKGAPAGKPAKPNGASARPAKAAAPAGSRNKKKRKR